MDPEIICLHLKKKEINASKIYIPVGKFAEWAKRELMSDDSTEPCLAYCIIYITGTNTYS